MGSLSLTGPLLLGPFYEIINWTSPLTIVSLNPFRHRIWKAGSTLDNNLNMLKASIRKKQKYGNMFLIDILIIVAQLFIFKETNFVGVMFPK